MEYQALNVSDNSVFSIDKEDKVVAWPEVLSICFIGVPSMLVNLLLFLAIMANPRLRNRASYVVLMCLSIVDFLCLLTAPFTAATYFHNYFLWGNVECQVVTFLDSMRLCAPTLLIALSLAIHAVQLQHSQQDKWLPPGGAVIAMFAIFGLSLVIVIPVVHGAQVYQLVPGYVVCHQGSLQVKLSAAIWGLLLLLIMNANMVVLIATYCISKNQRKERGKTSLTLALIVACVFQFAQLCPYLVIHMINTFSLFGYVHMVESLSTLYTPCFILCYASSFVRPLVFPCISSDIQDSYRLLCPCCRHRPTILPSQVHHAEMKPLTNNT